jgi:hypothetical protein
MARFTLAASILLVVLSLDISNSCLQETLNSSPCTQSTSNRKYDTSSGYWLMFEYPENLNDLKVIIKKTQFLEKNEYLVASPPSEARNGSYPFY